MRTCLAIEASGACCCINWTAQIAWEWDSNISNWGWWAEFCCLCKAPCCISKKSMQKQALQLNIYLKQDMETWQQTWSYERAARIRWISRDGSIRGALTLHMNLDPVEIESTERKEKKRRDHGLRMYRLSSFYPMFADWWQSDPSAYTAAQHCWALDLKGKVGATQLKTCRFVTGLHWLGPLESLSWGTAGRIRSIAGHCPKHSCDVEMFQV